MILYLKDENGAIYTFNKTFSIEGTPFKIKINKKDIAFSHGAIDTGDGKIEERYVTLKGTIYGSTDAEYEANLNALFAAIYKQDQTLYFDNEKYIEFTKLVSVNPVNIKGADLRACDIAIQFLAEDPFWYYVAPSTKNQAITGTPTLFDAINEGSVEAYPIISICNNGSYVPMTLRNLTGASLVFKYDEFGFLDGATLVVDCVEGTVKRDGINTLRYFDGAFLHLVASTNSLLLDGLTDANVLVEWHRRQL